MIFDVYFPFVNKDGKLCPGVKPFYMEWCDIMSMMKGPEHTQKVEHAREVKDDKDAYAEAKKAIPAVCFVGFTEKTRAVHNTEPTGLVMIDIDHCEKPTRVWAEIHDKIVSLLGEDWLRKDMLCVHRTVGGAGIRIVFYGQKEQSTLAANMQWFKDNFFEESMGDFDPCTKDFSRISFLPKGEDFFFLNERLLEVKGRVLNPTELRNNYREEEVKKEGELFSEQETIDNFTDEERQEFEAFEYRGTLIKTILEKWVEVQGEPGKGEIHNYYNEMVKYFRCICNNNKRCLLYLLPRFGHSASECWSSIVSICRVNTLSTLPRPFYFFLKDNGFYKPRVMQQGALADYMMSEQPDIEDASLPWLPPVFREFVKIAPKDFRPSMVNALLPIMGTLTSYLQAPYYYDGRMHTTSFFSVIYAPAGTGKGFVERMINILFEQIKTRDYVQQAREKIYLETLDRKGDNEKSPERPVTSLRIIPPKNSEAEFLQKQHDNMGYHMFTYAPEMDSWAKGVRAAGGNKDDMIRIAWDNGEYGQQFKSSGTFKGTVNLYWNVLITGTVQQLMSYFKNVENGLITRCSFTTIENQEFAEVPIWKQSSKKDLAIFRKFMERCDRNSYKEPCDIFPSDVDCVSADKFDEEINWRFSFRPKKTVDMEWLKPTIDKFLSAQLKKSALDLDKARDVFRRRAAVRGFRLGLICHALWERPRQSDLERCIPFIEWWMDQDLESSLKLWGARYNMEAEEQPNLNQRSVYAQLAQAFTKDDVYRICVRQGIKSPVRQIIYQWKKQGFVRESNDGNWEKCGK